MLQFLRTYRKQRAHAKTIKANYLAQKAQNSGNVHFYNWWPVEDYSSLWLYRFVQNTGLLNGSKKQINFCSMFDERKVLNHVNYGIKVFFSGENLHNPQWSEYADGLLGDKDCRLSLGFDHTDDDRYLRFPLWLTYVFEPTLDEQKIRDRCAQLRNPEIGKREKFACLISRADESGLRTEMYNALSKMGRVVCPSKLFHNDDSLKTQFDDNKVAYLQQYRFNVCPENTNADGYTTEKVFEAIAAGCIPVYWGNNNQPESKILNQDAIIFWDKENGGKNAIKRIKELNADPKLLDTFMQQPRLLPNAEEEILQMLNELYERLQNLVNSEK